jgi:hypothetical protein
MPVLSRPTDIPAIMLVAGPVLLACRNIIIYVHDFSHWIKVIVGVITRYFYEQITDADSNPSAHSELYPTSFIIQKIKTNYWKSYNSNYRGNCIAFFHDI